MEKRSVAPQTTTPTNEESLPKRRASGEVDCCVRKRLVCPPLSPTTTCAKLSPWRWCCKICGYYTRYFHNTEECERLHFGPLITAPTNDIVERDDNDDDNGFLVNGVVVLRSSTLIPPGTPYTPPLEQPTPPTVSSSDSEDVGVKPTVDDGHIAAAAA